MLYVSAILLISKYAIDDSSRVALRVQSSRNRLQMSIAQSSISIRNALMPGTQTTFLSTSLVWLT